MKIKENELLFAKVEEDAIIPTKRDEDAAYDVYTCEKETIVIPPCSVKMIDTGIAIGCNKAYFPKFFDKGCMGSKGLIIGAGVGDSGYRNKYFVPINNINRDKYFILTAQSKEEVENSICFDKIKNKFVTIDEVDKNSIIPSSNSNEFLYERLIDKKDCIIKYINKAFASFVILPVPKLTVKEVSYDELVQYKSERGLGNLGSSGK